MTAKNLAKSPTIFSPFVPSRRRSGAARGLLFALAGLAALVTWAPGAVAYEQWSVDRFSGNCADCHGNYRQAGYGSFKDGTPWGTSLHDGHRDVMLSFQDCTICHTGGSTTRFPVLLNSSTGATDYDPISCLGCHGRTEDQAGGAVTGAGLRQHHTNAGVPADSNGDLCVDCHADADPANFTTAAESVQPPYYFTPDPTHPNKPTNACNDPAGSEAIFGPTGLDNDGDGPLARPNPDFEDGNDSDCAVPVPDIALNPTSLDFGVVFIGDTGIDTFQILNVGTADLIVTGIAPAAGTSAEYSFVAPPPPFVIPPGGSQTVTVTFAPVDVGLETGALEIASNDPDEPTVPLPLSGTGDELVPDINLDPVALDFGTVTVGNDATLGSNIQNLGTADLTVTAIDLCAGTSAEFGFTAPATPFTIPVGGSQTLSVTYTPADVGPDTGCIAVASDDPDEPTVELAVDGIGAAPPVCDIDVNPLTLDYGTVFAGSVNTLSTTVGNTGTADCTVDSLTLSGSADFSLGAGAPVPPFTVTPGGTVDVPVTYSPPDTGPDSGTLSIASNDPIEPIVDVTLSGVAELPPTPDINLDPVALDFGPVTVGASNTLSSQVQNVGTADLVVSMVNLCAGTSTEYSFLPLASTTIAPGTSETLTVTYAPVDLGTDLGCIAIAINDPDEATVELSLAGSGVPPPEPDINLDPPELAFGTVFIGEFSTLTSQIQNVGDADLTVTDITPSAGTSAEFSFTAPATPFVVPVGGSQAVSVTYAPVDVVPDTGSLEISSNDPDEPVAALGLSGSGEEPVVLEPDINLDPMALDFGALPIGSSSTLASDIQNLGNADLEVMMVNRCAGTSAEFDFADPSPATIPPGGSRALPVTYTPVDEGMDMGCLEVLSNDPDEPLVELGLTGTGGPVPPMEVALEVPGAINPENSGVTPITFLGDMMDLEIFFVECGPATAEPRRLNVEDVDGDGYLDVVGLFETKALGISCGDETLSCIGILADGTRFESESEEFKTVGGSCKTDKDKSKQTARND